MQTRRITHARSAFTLLELLIVIGIIAGLAAITTLVGTAVLDTGKKRATLGVLQTLDEALAAYTDQKSSNPPPLVEIPYERMSGSEVASSLDPGESLYFPAVDGRGAENTNDEFLEINSVALFIESVRSVPETQELVNSINPRYIRLYTPNDEYFPQLLTAFDAWGNPIRYVHPKFDGIQEREPRSLGDAGEPVNIANPRKPFFVAGALPEDFTTVIRFKFIRRNRLIDADFGDDGLSGGSQGGMNMGTLSDYDLLPDSDGGITPGNRPYFYSAGPDGNPATIEDNIYINPVQHADPGVN